MGLRLRAGVLALGLTLVGAASAGVFIDMPCHWSYQAIEKLDSVGVLDGYPDGRFLLNQPVTRREFTFMVGRTVSWISEMLTKDGVPGVVDTDVVLRDRVLFEAVWGPRFSDVPPDHWAAAALRRASSCRLDAGAVSGTRRPEETLTRGEAMVAIYRLLDLMAFRCAPDSAGLGRDAAAANLAEIGVFEGYPDSQLHLDRPLLRDEVPVVLVRLYDAARKKSPPPAHPT